MNRGSTIALNRHGTGGPWHASAHAYQLAADVQYPPEIRHYERANSMLGGAVAGRISKACGAGLSIAELACGQVDERSFSFSDDDERHARWLQCPESPREHEPVEVFAVGATRLSR